MLFVLLEKLLVVAASAIFLFFWANGSNKEGSAFGY